MKTTATLILTLALGVLAVAQDAAVPDWFKKLDRNGDGKITREEMPKLFDLIDTNKDGVGSLEEVTDYFAKHPPQRQASGDGKPAATGASKAAATDNKPAASGEPKGRRELPADVEKRAVTIWSDGTRMVGDLYLPKNRTAEAKLPGIVLCAGTGGTKGGTGARLGVILAQHGYAALAFDYRGWGESDPRLMALEKVPAPDEKGEVTVKARAVRWQMDFADQTMDIRAAISFLAGEPGVDKERIGIWGSSYGGGLVTWTAGNDPRVKCTAAQVGGVGPARNPRAIAGTFDYLTKQSRAEVEPVPFETGKMTGKMAVYSQMRVNPTKGIGYSTAEAAEKITTPILFVVAENEELGSNANTERAAAAIRERGVPAEYHVIKGITHYGVYKEGFDEATNLELAWFDKHLKGAAAAKATEAEAAKPAPTLAPVPEAKAPAAPATGAQRSPEEAFKLLDIDGDGKLSEAEFGQLKEAVAYFREHPEAVGPTFKKLDSAGAGALSLEDFRKFYEFGKKRAQANAPAPEAKPTEPAAPAAPAKPGRPPEEVFAYLDTDADGKLSVSEFEGLGEAIPYFKEHPEAVPGIFKKFDTDGNGALSLAEFRAFVERRTPGAAAEKPAPKPEPAKPSAAANTPPTAEGIAFFEKNIRPVLADKCYKCHSADAEKIKGGLVLDTRDGIRMGGDSGPAVAPGDLAKSLLIEAVRYTNKDTQMPPQKQGGKLSDTVIANFEKWVQMGAPDPRAGTGAKVVKSSINIEKGREHWAFHPVKKSPPPAVRDAAWPRSDIDRFLLSAMDAKGVKPVADAEPRALIRRVTFDLTGLPPTAEEVEAFVADSIRNPQSAIANATDRLLASPRFGERWGRHWLDVARYADSTGRGSNILYPQAWRYRDYVIASFNADKPYDAFVREQIAGDLLLAKDDAERAEHTVATGFLAIGAKQLCERDRLKFQLDVVDEQLDTVGQAMLATTIGCARCHDHKFDPIPQRDYYALAGIFRSTETCYGTVPVITNNQASKLIELPASAPRVESPVSAERLRAEQARLDKELRELTGGFGIEQFRLPADADKARKSIGVRSRLVVKKLIREIVLSRAYQLGTNYESANYSTDPDNTLVWRMTPRRLDAESARDAMLAVSGKLESQPPLASTAGRLGDNFAGVAAARAPAEAVSGVRSVYLTILRDQLNDALGLFDFANPNAVTGDREETTTPAQSLFLMNSPVMQALAEVWAKRLLLAPGDGLTRVKAAYLQAFGREPTDNEQRATKEFFDRFLADAGTDETKRRELFPTALNAFCQALFSSAEFRTLN